MKIICHYPTISFFTVLVFLLFQFPIQCQTWKLDSLVSQKGYKYSFTYNGERLVEERHTKINGSKSSIIYEFDSLGRLDQKVKTNLNNNSVVVCPCTYDDCDNLMMCEEDEDLYFHGDCIGGDNWGFGQWVDYYTFGMIDIDPGTSIERIWHIEEGEPIKFWYFYNGCDCCDPPYPDYSIRYETYSGSPSTVYREGCGVLNQYNTYAKIFRVNKLDYKNKSYDDLGENEEVTTGTILTYEYDSNGNMSKSIGYESGLVLTSYSYDLSVNRTEIIMPDVIQKRDYIGYNFLIDVYENMRTVKIDYTDNGNDTMRYYYSGVEPSYTENPALELSSLSIFPNPSDQLIYLELDKVLTADNYSIRIFDTRGELINLQTMPEEGFLDISQLNNGIYYLELQNKSTQVNVLRKFVKF